MRIERNSLSTVTANIRTFRKAATPASNGPLHSFEKSERLDSALANTPDVRAEKIARAKALVSDPNYPSEKQIKKIAQLLAANWTREDSVAAEVPRLLPQTLGQD